MAREQDYDAFYENEIQVRKAYEFPPFCDIALLTVSSIFEGNLERETDKLMKRLEKELTELGLPVKAYGPFEAPIYKSNGIYRKRILIKCKLNNRLRGVFSQAYIDFTKANDKVHLSIDFNPSNI